MLKGEDRDLTLPRENNVEKNNVGSFMHHCVHTFSSDFGFIQ